MFEEREIVMKERPFAKLLCFRVIVVLHCLFDQKLVLRVQTHDAITIHTMLTSEKIPPSTAPTNIGAASWSQDIFLP